MNKRVLRIIIILLAVMLVGTAGYMVIEGWSFLDAVFMTIITLSTIGYGEVHPLSDTGRIFSIVLIFLGVGGMSYALTTMVQYFMGGELALIMGRRKMKDRIQNLKDHIILCGYRRVGREVARVFEEEGMPFVVIDIDQGAIEKAAADGCLYILGDATSDETLKRAGIMKARALVAALGNDVDNVYITLSAKDMRPDLFVVSRFSTPESESRLKQVGADRLISPHSMGGRRMALLTLRPLVVDFIDTIMHSRKGEMMLENVKVAVGSEAAGLNVKDGSRIWGATAILAIKKKNGNLIANPPGDMPIDVGDELVVIGTREQLKDFERTVASSER